MLRPGYRLGFEDIDIINNRAHYEEMVRKSGQPLSPCVESCSSPLCTATVGQASETSRLIVDLCRPSIWAIA